MALLILGAGMIAKAQEKKAAVPNDQAWLQKFVGKWTGTVVITDDKKQSTTLTTFMEWTSIADGKGISGVETLEDAKLGKMSFYYLMGYDPYEKKLHFYAVNSGDICHDHNCTWKSADHCYIEHNSLRNGKAFKETVDLVFKDKNTIEFTETDYLDKKVTETDKGTYKKAQ